MTKKQRELQAQINVKLAEVKNLREAETPDAEAIKKGLDEVDALQALYDLEERAEQAGKKSVPTTPVAAPEAKKADGFKALAAAARAGFKTLNETTGADGGFTVPEDVQTKIHELREERFSLASLIDSEVVSTNSGKRTYKKRAQHTGFTEVGEGAVIGKTSKPQFTTLEYKIKKYAGYLPVTNELLGDSDAAIAQVIMQWLAEEGVATDNAQILAKVNSVEATALTGMKDIKKAVNVTLAAFAGSVRIVINSDGLQYLDTLEDKNGRPLLSPNPANPMVPSLAVGTRNIPVIVVPNAVLPTPESGKLPFIIGDLFEFCRKEDRKQLTLTQTSEATVGEFNAFEQDMTLFRAIMRADYVIKDAAAIVRGELTVTA